MLFKYLLTVILISLFPISSISQYVVPVPIMGHKVMKEFIKTHLDYPERELRQKIQGTVKIEFTTDQKGNVTNYHISQSISYLLDSSTISLFKLILWKPATSMGKPVIGSSEFKIKYNINSFNKLVKRRGYKHIVLPSTPIDTSGTIYGLKQLDSLPKAILSPNLNSIYDYIYTNLTYPDPAAKLALSGKVELSFIIETNGLPSNIIPLKYLGGGCTEEAIRIVQSIIWKPGILNQEAVRTKYILSINFQKNENRDSHIPNQQGSGI